MPRATAVAEAGDRVPSFARPALAAVARMLTLLRFAAVIPFVWLFAATARQVDSRMEATLVVFYLAVAFSDLIDGKLARLAGAASPRWGRIDIAADMAFNVASLACAAALGRVGFWVPAGVAVLGGRFLLRTLGKPPTNAIAYDRAGNFAGVLYYVLVGVIVFDQRLRVLEPWIVARAGDGVFVYTLLVLLGRLPKSSA